MKALGWTPGAIIDIGVATGTSGLYSVWPGTPICLVEPSPQARPYLEEIAARFPQVKVYNVAASSASGEVAGTHHPSRPNAVIGEAKPNWPRASFPAMTCDEIVADAGLSPPFLYKLDTDTHELEILDGSAATLGQTDVCVVEVNVFYPRRGLATPDAIWRRLHDAGFAFFDMIGGGYGETGVLRCADMLFVKSSSALFKWADKRSPKAADTLGDRLMV